MMSYTLTVDCETCGAKMRHRVADLTADPDGELEINLSMSVSQITLECSVCGGVTYTGDFDDMCEHEPGTEPDGDEEEDL